MSTMASVVSATKAGAALTVERPFATPTASMENASTKTPVYASQAGRATFATRGTATIASMASVSDPSNANASMAIQEATAAYL